MLLLHGSGPGVSAWANWRLLLPVLAHTRRVVAPDLLGLGYNERPTDPANPPEGTQYRMEVWVRQATFAPCRITR